MSSDIFVLVDESHRSNYGQLSTKMRTVFPNACYIGFTGTPLMKKEKVGAINWGFVAGKTNTIFAWDDVIPSGEEPELWFHDIYRPTGVPYQQEEVDCIQSLTGKR